MKFYVNHSELRVTSPAINRSSIIVSSIPYGLAGLLLNTLYQVGTLKKAENQYVSQSTSDRILRLLSPVDSLVGVAWTMKNAVMKGDKASDLLFYAECKEGLYRLRLEDENGFEAHTFNVQDAERIWHSRLGHASQKIMSILHKLVDGVPKLDATQCFCEPCTLAKLQKTISRKASVPATQGRDLVHSDVRTMPVESVGGLKYYVTFINDKTRYRRTYPLKQKSQIEATFKSWKQPVEAESGFKLQRFRTDGGGEYCYESMLGYMFEHGIKHEKTPTHTPEMNSVSKRFSRTLVEKAKSMLHESQLDFVWWGEALATATYLVNVLPTAALKDSTPLQEWKEVKPDLAHLRIFGSECWVQVPKANRKKLDHRAVKVRLSLEEVALAGKVGATSELLENRRESLDIIKYGSVGAELGGGRFFTQ